MKSIFLNCVYFSFSRGFLQSLSFPPRVFSFWKEKRLGQAEILNLILLFFIVTVLVMSTFFWGKPVLEKNIDRNSVLAAEQFMRSMDSKIQSIAKFGGKDSVSIDFGKLELKENFSDPFDDILEFSLPITLEMPEQWLYLNTANSEKFGALSDTASILRERKNGNTLEIQLYYRMRSDGSRYFIDLFAEGNKIAAGEIAIEKNETVQTKINNKGVSVTKIKLIFK